MPRLPQQLAYYPHIIILAIQLQQRNLEPLRFDSTYSTCMYLSNKYSQTFQQGTLLHESHPRWHSCMCKKKVETSAAHRGRSFLPIDCHDGHVSEKYLPGQVVHFFFLFFLNMNLTFLFAITTRGGRD